MRQPLVSVVIPAHDRIALLREALGSVAAQTFRDFEVIVVDDGSPEPLAPLIGDHPARPRVIRQAQQGPAAARNAGIAGANGQLIAFLDSDDLWLPAKLERFVAALSAAGAPRIFYGPMIAFDDRNDRVAGRGKPRHAGHITDRLFESCFIDVPTVVCWKDVLTRAGAFDASLPVCEDYDLWLRLSLTEDFGLIKEPLAKRRLHPARLSKSQMSRNLAVKALVLRRFFDRHRANGTLGSPGAEARLARVHYLAARAAFRNGEYARAAELSRTSRSYRGAPLRSAPLQWAARAMARLRGAALIGLRTSATESGPPV